MLCRRATPPAALPRCRPTPRLVRSAVADISQPSRASGDAERRGRILRLRLTDGKAACVGIEFAPLPHTLEQVGVAG